MAMVDLLRGADNPAATAPDMVSAAAEVTARRMRLPSPAAALRRAQLGDATAVSYFRYELARQVALTLLALDHHVEAVYEEQIAPEAEELPPPAPGLADPLRIYVCVTVETAALHALLAALDIALAAAVREELGGARLGRLEAMILDRGRHDALVLRRGGYRPAPMLLADRSAALGSV